MGESRGDKVRIWTDVPLHRCPLTNTIMSVSKKAMSGRLLFKQIKVSGHVLWPHQQPSYLLDHDEQNITGSHHRGSCLS
jgi:hypothetical protein